MLGKLDERVTIQAETSTDDGLGGQRKAWAQISSGAPTVWARIVPLHGSEQDQRERVRALQTYMITIRYRNDLTPDMRLSWRGRLLNIRRIEDAGPRPLYLTIIAEEGAPTNG